jgi:hypothetical protein
MLYLLMLVPVLLCAALWLVPPARRDAAAALGLLAALVSVGVCGCPKNATEGQARALDVEARLLNAGKPLWLAEFERTGQDAIRRAIEACGGDAACRAREGGAAFDRHTRAWDAVALSWEGTKARHDAWRDEVERCRAASDPVCAVTLERGARAFVAQALEFRCALRALGRADLDPLAGLGALAPRCPELLDADGGAP